MKIGDIIGFKNSLNEITYNGQYAVVSSISDGYYGYEILENDDKELIGKTFGIGGDHIFLVTDPKILRRINKLLIFR